MAKRVFVFLIVGLVLLYFGISMGANVAKKNPNTLTKMRVKEAALMTGDEKIDQANYVPTRPGLLTGSPGDTVGWTQYDYQSNGSSGNRVALGSTGGVHFAWMNAITFPAPRSVYYNFVDNGGGWLNGSVGVQASQTIGTGYNQLALTGDDRAVIAYHRAPSGAESTMVAVDAFEGIGSFSYYKPIIWFGAAHCIWPYVTVDRTGRYHVTASQTTAAAGDPQITGYRRSSDGGATWTNAVQIDTVMVIATVITSSPVSDKVAIVYAHPGILPVDSTQWSNDIVYVQSTDGTTWNFGSGIVNVTDYANDSDSLWAYTDLDAVYDYNDNLHIIWSAFPHSPEGSLYFLTNLEHFSTGTGIINTICQSVPEFDTSTCGANSQSFGAWNWTICKMSIGADPQNNLFATFTSWYTTDIALDNCANGEIFLSYSNDNGQTWTLKGDITNSHSDSCDAGDCDSDHWSSLAEKVGDDLHIFYVNDKDAGGIPQTEGAVTDNPMLYLAYPNPVRTQALPGVPTPIFPYNHYQSDYGYYQFEWSDAVGVLHYEIQLDDANDFATPIATDNNIRDFRWINPDSLVSGTYYWRVRSVGFYGTSAWSPTWDFSVTGGGGGNCDYTPGDINGNGTPNGIDVVFGVNYFKGISTPPINCSPFCPNQPAPFYAAGDVNGNCSFNGIDVTFFVRYLKGQVPALLYCADCPPAP